MDAFEEKWVYDVWKLNSEVLEGLIASLQNQ